MSIFVLQDKADGKILTREGRLPTRDEVRAIEGSFKDRGYVCAPIESGDEWALIDDAPHEFDFISRRDAAAIVDAETFARMNTAFLMMNFTRRSRFCGSCGARMTPHETERARVCERCGAIVYPTMAPAVIVAVTKGDALLLGHNAAFPSGRYSVIAGFVEPGENAEHTVAREVWEEARVRVKDVRYFSSQPWPFPNSLMLGYFASWDSGDPTPGDGELTDVAWFTRDSLPDLPPPISIARRLIDAWLDGRHLRRSDNFIPDGA